MASFPGCPFALMKNKNGGGFDFKMLKVASRNNLMAIETLLLTPASTINVYTKSDSYTPKNLDQDPQSTYESYPTTTICFVTVLWVSWTEPLGMLQAVHIPKNHWSCSISKKNLFTVF